MPKLTRSTTRASKGATKKIAAAPKKTIKKAVKGKKKATKVTKNSNVFWTKERNTQLGKLLKQIQHLKNDTLKAILRKNDQSMSGNKIVLLGKVADGLLFGKIPRCTQCGGGRPKFDMQTGTYICNGYQDDEVWKNCKTTYSFSDLPREKFEIDSSLLNTSLVT